MPSIDIYKTSFRPMKHTLSGRDERMLMKLVVNGETTRCWAATSLDPMPAKWRNCWAFRCKLGATKADFDATMAVHPTAAEELVTMRDTWHPAK